MKPNGIKKDGNKFFLASVMKIYMYDVSGIASVLNSPFISLAELCLRALCAALGEFEF
jgi:hypothetical protein